MRPGRLPAFTTTAAAVVLLLAPSGVAEGAQPNLSLCYVNTLLDQSFDLELVADGPSYRSVSLDAGECADEKVRPGRYKITIEDPEVYADPSCPPGRSPAQSITIERDGHLYRASQMGFQQRGAIYTNVERSQLTTVTVRLECLD